MKNLILFLFAFYFINLSNDAYGATITAATSGNWGATTTWSGSVLPKAGDIVVIDNGRTVTVDITNAVCTSINLGTGSNNQNAVLSFASNGVLSVSGNISIGGSGNRLGSMDFTSGGVLKIAGTISVSNLGYFNAPFGTIEFNGAGQTIPNIGNYYNITLSGSGVKDLTNVTVNGILSMEGTATVSNPPTYGSAATLQYNKTAPFTASGEWVSGFSSNGGIIINSSVVTLNSSEIVNAPLNLFGGKLSIGAYTLSLNGLFNGSATNCLVGSASSNLSILANTSFVGGLYFDQTTPGTTNNIATFTINRSGQTVLLGNNLVVSTTLNLTLGKLALGSGTLTLNGNTSGNSASNCFVGDGGVSSSLIINGSGAFNSLYFDQSAGGTTNKIKNLTINRTSSTITLANSLELSGTLTLSNGTFATGGNLKITSDVNGTGRIPEITGTGAITGNVTVERYIPSSQRRWRFMSSNVSGTTLADWKNEIYVTGPGTGNTVGTTNSNGFDATTSNAASVYYYDETAIGSKNNGWTSASSTSMALTSGKGYRVFVRGDRSDLGRLSGTNNTQNAVTLNLTGTLNTGNITMPVSYTNNGSSVDDGWNLLGNPYACQYDWNPFWDAGNSGYSGTNYTNIDPTVYVWDATTNTYLSFNAASNTGSMDNGIIASGQSFFVKATAASPTMTFKEQFKSAITPHQMFKTGSTASDELRVRMFLDTFDYDEFVLKFISSSTNLDDMYDIVKWINPTVNISSYGSDNINHTVDCRPMISTRDTIFMNVSGVVGTYKFIFHQLPTVGGKYYFLHDLYLSTFTLIGLNDEYTFSLDTNAGSYGPGRFRIYVNNSSVLPVTFGKFDVVKSGTKALLNWSTVSEQNNAFFAIERSSDNCNFLNIGTVQGIGNSNNTVKYSFTDEEPFIQATNYYRIKQINTKGEFDYSLVRSLAFNEKANQPITKVYPNPASTQITLTHEGLCGQFDVSIYTVEGVLLRKINAVPVVNNELIINLAGINDGLYVIKANDALGDLLLAKFIVTNF